jgi:hypothetical protein
MKSNTFELVDKFNRIHKIHHLGNLNPIDEIVAQNYNNDNFKTNYLKANGPLILRNGLDYFECGNAYKDWSLSYLIDKCGDNKVYVRRNTCKDAYKTGKAYEVQETLFKSYIQDLFDKNETSKNSYLAVQNIRKAFAQINDDLRLPAFVEKLHAGPFLWIAREGHYEYTHMDPDDNLLIVIRGQKLVRLYGCNVYALQPNKLGSKGRTIQSQINLFSDTYEDFDPKVNIDQFKQTECLYGLLNEGDMLYFPAFWWHQVTSPIQTISVNVFFGDSGENLFVQKCLNSSQHDSLLYWLFNIIEQNRSYDSFNRILPKLKESLKSFLFKQWHETLDDNQINYVYDKIIEHFKFDIGLLQHVDNNNSSSKNPPQLKIRGLLWRESKDGKKLIDED